MLAVGPAWHPSPFPGSPCLGCPPTSPPLPQVDQNKERDLFFTRLLLWPNDITSAASSPQIPAARRIFPFAVDPPFYLNSTILHQNQRTRLQKKTKKQNAQFMLSVFVFMLQYPLSGSCNQEMGRAHSENQ